MHHHTQLGAWTHSFLSGADEWRLPAAFVPPPSLQALCQWVKVADLVDLAEKVYLHICSIQDVDDLDPTLKAVRELLDRVVLLQVFLGVVFKHHKTTLASTFSLAEHSSRAAIIVSAFVKEAARYLPKAKVGTTVGELNEGSEGAGEGGGKKEEGAAERHGTGGQTNVRADACRACRRAQLH